MKKRTLIFYLSKIIWKSAFYFGFVSKKVARATASKYKAETNAHILIYKNGYSFQFLSPLFSLEKFSHFLSLPDNSTHLQKQKIFPQESGFPYHKDRQIQFKKRVQRFSPENLILSLQTGF